MRNIVIITTSFPNNIPGTEAAGSFVKDFSLELAQHTTVTIIAPGNTPGTEKYGEMQTHRFAAPLLPLSRLSMFNPGHWVAIYKTLKSGMDVIRDICTPEKHDYILALWALPSGYWARKVMKSCNINYAIWALGSDIWSFKNKPVLRNILKKVLVDADRCFADGYSLKSDVEKLSGRTCHFLPSARQLNPVKKREQREKPPYRIAYLGRWHKNKGIDLLMKVLDTFDNSDWERIEEIRIYGGGPFESLVLDSVQELRSKSRPVVHGGYLSKEDAMELITWADYLLIPSRIESVPVIFSDAMQCRTPVVAMPAGDLPELIMENNVGIVADEITPAAFTRAIRQALHTSPVIYNNGMDSICAKFDIRNIVNQFLSIVDK